MAELQGISINAFAKRIGVTHNAVTARIKSGKKIGDAVLSDNSLDPDLAEPYWWQDYQHSEGRRGPPRKSDRDGDSEEKKLSQSDARKINLLKLEKLANEVETGKLNLEELRRNSIDRRVAKLAVANLMRMVREGLMNFGSRHGPDIAAKVDCEPRDLVAAIDEAMRDTLQDLTADRNLPDDFK